VAADPDVDGLYGLALERFVPARAALAKELRAAGRRDDAKAVAELRKPTVAAWAVNQLVRTQARAMTQLFEAGDLLRDAQEAVVAGRSDPGTLRAAAQAERQAVDELLSKAGGLLTSDGHALGQAIVERVSATLHAAALDDDARELVRDGRLQQELQHVGFGMVGEGVAVTARPARDGAAEREHERDRTAAEERVRQRAAAEQREAQARRDADAAEQALSEAEERHERAREALGLAEEQLARARASASAAADALKRAQQVRAELQRGASSG
jgi:hypothetical protein